MKNKPCFVFDTNTIISAFPIEQGNPGRALHEAQDRGDLLLSMEVAEECAKVIRREKFDRYVKRKTREELVRALIEEAVFYKDYRDYSGMPGCQR